MPNTISNILINWYSDNKRDLPWRLSPNPFHVWLSEIILQQTRVNQGMDYYYRFTKRFDTIRDLANADEAEILRLWQGLGYYSRARNLHFAAKQIVDNHNGEFPNNYKDIRALKGVGDYTAAAIGSIVFDLPHATVDGNVYRVLSRLFGVETPINTSAGKKEFAELAQELLDKEAPGTHNQAIMEFGALQCTPKNPDCSTCPLSNVCVAYASSLVDKLPVKQGKISIRKRYFHYYYITNKQDDKFAIIQRRHKDIWQNMYEFPLLESDKQLTINEIIENQQFRKMLAGIDFTLGNASNPLVHKLTHQHLYCIFIPVKIPEPQQLLDDIQWVNTKSVDKYALPKVIERYLEQINNAQLFPFT